MGWNVKIPRVAALLGTERQYQRDVLHGIARYARLHARWLIEAEPSLNNLYQGKSRSDFNAALETDGVIMFITDESQLRLLRRRRVPFVNMTSLFAAPDIPCVVNDSDAICCMAVEHFVERGFRHFAYCELDQYSRLRRQHFIEALAAAGSTCHIFEVTYAQRDDWARRRDRRRLLKWLAELPKPIGILAHNDVRARHLADACRQGRLRVPDEVAILGVDNDLLHCELSLPPTSSIATDAQRIGYCAAQLLDDLMNKRNPKQLRIAVPPKGIVTRQSTDVQATEDPIVKLAVRFIREQATSGIKVTDVLRQVVVSRTVLDERFRSVLGRTAHEEIIRIRLQHAQRLLVETKLSIEEIAARTGFHHGEYLGVVFAKRLGQTPGQFRHAYQQSSSGHRE
jgi:LacI family transcriptional regulator